MGASILHLLRNIIVIFAHSKYQRRSQAACTYRGMSREGETTMDDRIVTALVLGILMLAAITGLGIRYMQKRRAFKLRQQGRGKNMDRVPAE
jgi:hypothetical protein